MASRRSHHDARSARWQVHREQRRAELVEATVAAVLRHGAGVGMDQIAAQAGVSKPVLYRHFADQAELYVAVGRRLAAELVGRITPALEAATDERGHVGAVIDAYLAAIEEQPELYRFVVRRPLVNRPVENDPVSDYRSVVATMITRVLGERLRAAGLDSGGAEAWGHGLVGMVQTAGDWWLERRSMSRASLTEYLTVLVWDGFSGVLRAGPAARLLHAVSPPAP